MEHFKWSDYKQQLGHETVNCSKSFIQQFSESSSHSFLQKQKRIASL